MVTMVEVAAVEVAAVVGVIELLFCSQIEILR